MEAISQSAALLALAPAERARFFMAGRFAGPESRLRRGESPAEVAAATGFCDQAHLTRAFKARVGVTPGVYRAAALA